MMHSNVEIPDVPAGINEAAEDFWRQVHEVTPLNDHERTILTQICRALTRIDELEAAWRQDGRYTINGVQGSTVIHPIFTEIRSQQTIVNTLFRTLKLNNIIGEVSSGKEAPLADPNVINLIERAKRKAN